VRGSSPELNAAKSEFLLTGMASSRALQGWLPGEAELSQNIREEWAAPAGVLQRVITASSLKLHCHFITISLHLSGVYTVYVCEGQKA